MTQRRPLSAFLALCLLLTLGLAPRARADETLGDAALIVGVSTLGGAVVGASTLPFYGSPGDHTKNIFYGAALGAVVGVLIAAYSGVKDAPEGDNAALAPASRTQPEALTSVRDLNFGGGAVVAWQPLLGARF